ncbi:hypothetical protein NDU88_006024 [Pleurodeles waltl]|uniref:Uncharacterized protein n=1 Tax=Pleurodeles waltl TaxID=8319 RepID=A0AAV7UJR5_PLEWA|nr:hypothetical protein NDU88_006024 [Pleurodeles waltl]
MAQLKLEYRFCAPAGASLEPRSLSQQDGGTEPPPPGASSLRCVSRDRARLNSSFSSPQRGFLAPRPPHQGFIRRGRLSGPGRPRSPVHSTLPHLRPRLTTGGKAAGPLRSRRADPALPNVPSPKRGAQPLPGSVRGSAAVFGCCLARRRHAYRYKLKRPLRSEEIKRAPSPAVGHAPPPSTSMS